MRPSVLFPLALCVAFAATPPALATAKRAAKTHVVSSGQRLDSIAKQYGVSADALRSANDLRPRVALKIGQRLIIPNPERSDEEIERARPAALEKERPSIVKASLSARPAAPLRHRVMHGETLAQIAARYGTGVAALSASNDLGKARTVRVGQLLSLPSGAKASRKSWHPYVKPVKRKGILDLSTPISRFTGPALDSDGRLRSSAVRALNGLLGAGGARPAVPERLIRLLIEVSDTFGGRPIRLVSGYRTASFYQDSRHKLSSAVDFLVVGVPNAVLCDYLRELEDVGVGYYPNSSFVHLDVRNHFSYWVDYAGPGEAPRSTPNAPNTPNTPRRADRKLLAELDGLLKRAKGAIEAARAGKNHGLSSAPKHEDEPRGEHEHEHQSESSTPGRGDSPSNSGLDET